MEDDLKTTADDLKTKKNVEEFFTKQKMIDLGISNNIPDLYEQYKQEKLRRIDFEIKWGKRVCILWMLSLIALFIYKTFINPQI
jgi:hypothetical protein